MIVAEVSVLPLGTESPSVGRYVTAAIRELEASGLRCSPGPMGTTVEAESAEEVYSAVTRAQAAIFDLGIERVYTILKMDERRDVESRTAEQMLRSVRGEQETR